MKLLPLQEHERIASIDAIRGAALLGVLLINLESDFRVPLARAASSFHTDPGLLNHVVDWILDIFVGGKAMSAFSFLFGVGLAMQAERARERASGRWLLVRRLAILFAIGVAHLLLLWNGDILALYAVAGLIALLFERRSTRTVCVAVVIIAAMSSFPYGGRMTVTFNREVTQEIERALHIYAEGSYADIVRFRLQETPRLMLPIYGILLPRTVGLFLLGMLAHRRGVFRRPAEHRRLLRFVFGGGVVVASIGTSLRALDTLGVLVLGRMRNPAAALSLVPLALAYVAVLLLFSCREPVRERMVWLSPVGRMALSNYLTQSLVLGFVFYGYGLGLFGRLTSAEALPIGLALFAVQVALSALWLRHFRFGPAEWLWRALTYGRRPPMSRARAAEHRTAQS